MGADTTPPSPDAAHRPDPGPGAPATPVEPIFLLSTVRSGSTLLQRALAAHPDIATTSEPWILLPLVYALRPTGVRAEYGHRLAITGIEDFAAHLPGGIEGYRAEVRELALRLYTAASPPGARFFVDKTPRYGLILDELHELFPHARKIFLFRNPLAVIASIIETWGDGRWNVYRSQLDLTTLLGNLADTYESRPEHSVAVRYEDLVRRPGQTLGRVFAHLGLDYDAAAMASVGEIDVGGRLGDKAGLEKYATISTASLDRWRETLRGPLRRRWCRRYLAELGDRRLAVMGYEARELLEELSALPAQFGTLPSDAVRMAYGRVYSWSARTALDSEFPASLARRMRPGAQRR